MLFLSRGKDYSQSTEQLRFTKTSLMSVIWRTKKDLHMCEVFERLKHPPVNVPNLDALDAPERQARFSFTFAWKQVNHFLWLLEKSLMCEMKTDGHLVKAQISQCDIALHHYKPCTHHKLSLCAPSESVIMIVPLKTQSEMKIKMVLLKACFDLPMLLATNLVYLNM